MKTSERFTNAVTKLYNAFHENRLNAYDCQACAVGNMCNNKEDWHDVLHFEKQATENGFIIAKNTGYSVDELRNIECIFMHGAKYDGGKLKWCPSDVNSKTNKDLVFKALRSVIEYLCELEGIPNVMDYTSLFETENDKPKHHLQEVF